MALAWRRSVGRSSHAPTSPSCWRTWVETSWREASSPRQGEFQSRERTCVLRDIFWTGIHSFFLIPFWKTVKVLLYENGNVFPAKQNKKIKNKTNYIQEYDKIKNRALMIQHYRKTTHHRKTLSIGLRNILSFFAGKMRKRHLEALRKIYKSMGSRLLYSI